jgi:Predicted ATPase
MITRFQVQNYKALRHVALKLTPFHALIGPNDSGKTSILNSLSAFCRTTEFELGRAFAGAWEGRELVWHDDPGGIVSFEAEAIVGQDRFRYQLACRFANVGRDVRVEREMIERNGQVECPSKDYHQSYVWRVANKNAGGTDDLLNGCRSVRAALSGVQYFRWNPRTLALPVAPDRTRQFRLNSDGFGLALLLDDILGYDRVQFADLESRFRQIFPAVTSLKLLRQPAFRAPVDDVEQVSKLDQADGKGLFFEVQGNKQLVPASQASDGTLLILAYLALLYSPQQPRLLLVEEPENGIHPRRLRDVLGILKELVKSQSHTQILMTTHSPYLVDLLEPEEATLCTKSKDGAINVKRLSDSELVRQQKSLFTLGEIWTSEGDEDLATDPAVPAS